MAPKLFFDVLTVEDIWLRQNAPDFLDRMCAQVESQLLSAGNPDQLANWRAEQHQKDAVWERHRHEIPRVRHWNEQDPQDLPKPRQKLEPEF